MEHEFTPQIFQVLQDFFGDDGIAIFERSTLLQYLNIKTRSASRGSKSRGSFANIYAIYVLVEDYLRNNFDKQNSYDDYDGARFTDLLERQRQLPFGSKLQNHALNSRMNEEFKKYFPHVEFIPIMRNAQTNRYWVNENLLKIADKHTTFNIAKAVMAIIDNYIVTKQSAFRTFIETCEKLQAIADKNDVVVSEFIENLLSPNSDARVFEIVSYAILRFYYRDQVVYFGFDLDNIHEENLLLFKTGRTNANDGGIDFVMRPLGRFFQVTETLDVKKYFLDIDKIEHFPISFVIKSDENVELLLAYLRDGAKRQYGINAIVDRYMGCIEEVINIPILLERFEIAKSQGYLRNVLDEIVSQSKVEFNFNDLESE
ncbi:MAG: restriction endonuclease [Chloroflexota bacterium]